MSLHLDSDANPNSKTDELAQIELDEGFPKDGLRATAEDLELQQAIRDYVPGTDAERKLVRQIDLHLVPILWVMYVLNYVDRTNIGNAKSAGMDVDLQLEGGRYAWVISIFFFGYLIMEVPSNMILSRARPSLFLPGIMIVWGAVSAAMASVQTYGAILAFRFVLGCIESGFFPGVLFVMSCWYTNAEIGKRFAIFYSAAVMSGAFGGILAGAITGHLDGVRGIAGWRWLFIIEGLATVAVAITATFILLDFPHTSTALTLEQQQLAAVRILVDSQDASGGERLSHWEAFKAAAVDPATYAFMLLLVLDSGAGTISYFIPTITKTLGYSTTTAQYMTVPIYMTAAVALNVLAWNADRVGERRGHIAGSLALGFGGALVCVVVATPVVRYVMLCFVAAGIWSALPLVIAWASKTIAFPAEKRAIAIAMINAVGNLSSVYGSQIWPGSSAPRYTLGWGVTAGFLGGGALVALLVPVFLSWVPQRPTRAERGRRARGEVLEEAGAEQAERRVV
ncbi:hypothetical protein QTJ16_005297 [Diplocarpon rosae]|uniref:Major facilitator superfamily (MFS) profile domain-containing protein n=1 Tax=Diplocarpon rosae TaxID=946125 RepID=A0AAD9SXH5_9HELO|nr:hypothetical protein QTJ16_005297 [Diplocarpon rosae]